MAEKDYGLYVEKKTECEMIRNREVLKKINTSRLFSRNFLENFCACLSFDSFDRYSLSKHAIETRLRIFCKFWSCRMLQNDNYMWLFNEHVPRFFLYVLRSRTAYSCDFLSISNLDSNARSKTTFTIKSDKKSGHLNSVVWSYKWIYQVSFINKK